MYNFSATYELRVTLFSVQCCYLRIFKLIDQPRGVYFFVDSTNMCYSRYRECMKFKVINWNETKWQENYPIWSSLWLLMYKKEITMASGYCFHFPCYSPNYLLIWLHQMDFGIWIPNWFSISCCHSNFHTSIVWSTI